MPVVARLSWHQGWRHVRSVVGIRARAYADGAFVSNGNRMTLPIAPLRAVRGTGNCGHSPRAESRLPLWLRFRPRLGLASGG